MDRQKYHKSLDYREGYDVGVKDGKNQISEQIDFYMKQMKYTCDMIIELCKENKNVDKGE